VGVLVQSRTGRPEEKETEDDETPAKH